MIKSALFLFSCLKTEPAHLKTPAQAPPPSYDIDKRGRRAFDLGFSSVILLLALPLMVAVPILIFLADGGPPLYRQERVGLHGRAFTMFKFRTMRVGSEGEAWTLARDPRITWVGAIIRRFRLDELPQLINVLRGEMSLIGPRPERPHLVQLLSSAIPGYMDRLCVKPGLTGWAQVNLPYAGSIADARIKLTFDLTYIERRSLTLDLIILLRTVWVVCLGRGAI